MSLPSGRRRLRWRPTPDTAIALTALVFAAGGGGYALAAATSEQVITACVDSASGTPTKIITAGTCDGGQTALSWNTNGPPGVQGVQGPAGPAGKDAAAPDEVTVVALPAKPSVKKARQFSVELLLPAPGVYQIDGHVDWSRGASRTNVRIDCSIVGGKPVKIIDSLATTVRAGEIFPGGAIDLSGLATVERPASTGPVAVLPAPVPVSFHCTARGASAKLIVFHDWTLSATPVKISAVKKRKP